MDDELDEDELDDTLEVLIEELDTLEVDTLLLLVLWLLLLLELLEDECELELTEELDEVLWLLLEELRSSTAMMRMLPDWNECGVVKFSTVGAPAVPPAA